MCLYVAFCDVGLVFFHVCKLNVQLQLGGRTQAITKKGSSILTVSGLKIYTFYY